MSGWVNKECDTVELKHYSTSSVIEVIVKSEEPNMDATMQVRPQTLWLSYKEFADLRSAVMETDFP